MGKPNSGHALLSERKGTWGTETSKYPEEKKSNEIPQVAASERGRAQTGRLRSPGVEDRQKSKPFKPKLLGRSGTDSETLVGERKARGLVSRVPRDTRNLVGSRVDHHPRQNTTERPIAHSTVRER